MIKKVREDYANHYGEGAPEVKMDEENFLKPPPKSEDDDPSLTWYPAFSPYLSLFV